MEIIEWDYAVHTISHHNLHNYYDLIEMRTTFAYEDDFCMRLYMNSKTNEDATVNIKGELFISLFYALHQTSGDQRRSVQYKHSDIQLIRGTRMLMCD